MGIDDQHNAKDRLLVRETDTITCYRPTFIVSVLYGLHVWPRPSSIMCAETAFCAILQQQLLITHAGMPVPVVSMGMSNDAGHSLLQQVCRAWLGKLTRLRGYFCSMVHDLDADLLPCANLSPLPLCTVATC